ncbi:MAG: hypothetical protein WAL55_16105 [Candidatus Acidiferrales bacterium]
MEHFSLEQWADFARNILEGKDKMEMQAHLETGCKRCASALSTWMRVSDVASRERAFQPPDTAVRSVKGLLAINGRPAKAPIAQLLFDSFRSPAAEGIRSTATVARQLLYGHGNYRIDLRMEPQFNSDKVSLVGQVLNSAKSAETAFQVPVMLLRGRKVLAKSLTNEFGEFHLECDLAGRLELQLVLPRGMAIKIPLIEPSIGAVTGNLEDADSGDVSRALSRTAKRTRKRV